MDDHRFAKLERLSRRHEFGTKNLCKQKVNRDQSHDVPRTTAQKWETSRSRIPIIVPEIMLVVSDPLAPAQLTA